MSQAVRAWVRRLMDQLAADCALLEELRVMDYSLLLGVHYRSTGWASSPPATDKVIQHTSWKIIPVLMALLTLALCSGRHSKNCQLHTEQGALCSRFFHCCQFFFIYGEVERVKHG